MRVLIEFHCCCFGKADGWQGRLFGGAVLSALLEIADCRHVDIGLNTGADGTETQSVRTDQTPDDR